ncbi:MAG TPA: hypothetical protein VH309_13550, partial [Elusimicrobiota bacterium]|nr:hypothetical protein [Elusimicrobiota bacterium]
MLDGVILLWFVLAALAVAFVAIDIRNTPESPVLMSMALLVGLIIASPMNWWLVANHLKHGMMTVRPKKEARMAMAMGGDQMAMGGGEMAGMAMEGA